VPIAAALAAPGSASITTGASLLALFVLGGVAARAGGAATLKGAVRVALWGALAMAMTALAGRAFGGVVA